MTTNAFSSRIRRAIELLDNDHRHDAAIAQSALYDLVGDLEKAGLGDLANRLDRAADKLESDHRHDVSSAESELDNILDALVALGR